jgi:transcriptional regulator with XRE-family HTH domain
LLPKWTGDVVGKLHVHNIEIRELAAKMGCAPEYLGKILNGKREPKNAEAKVKEALAELVKEREEK